MKRVGIIFAMDEELDALKEYLVIEKEYNIFDLTFYEGVLDGVYCILVKSGIGKVNAARSAQILIDNMKVDYIFNIGVAGGVDNKLSVGDIVIGKSLVQHDFNLVAFGRERGYIPNIGVFVESDNYLVNIASDILMDDINIFTGVIASGDIFCSDTNMSKKINAKFDTLCVEMEGASIAQVCYLSHIPFLIIRSISDVVDGENNISYEKFLLSSCKNVALFMRKLLSNLV